MMSESRDPPEPEARIRALEAEVAELTDRLRLALPPCGASAAFIPSAPVDPSASPPVEGASEGVAWSLSGLTSGLKDAVNLYAPAVLSAAGQQDGGISAVTATAVPPAALEVTWCRFEELVIQGRPRLCLLLADSSFCQVWDVEDPAEQRQLLQLRLNGVRCMAPLSGDCASAAEESDPPSPLGLDSSTLVIAATDNGVSILYLYSLAQEAFLHSEESVQQEVQQATDALLAGGPDAVGFSAALGTAPSVDPRGMQEVPLPGPQVQLLLKLNRAVCSMMAADRHLIVNLEGSTLIYDRRSMLPACPARRVAQLAPARAGAPPRSAVAVAKNRGWLAYATAASQSDATAIESPPLASQSDADGDHAMPSVEDFQHGLTAVTASATQLLHRVTASGDPSSTSASDAGSVTIEELCSPSVLTGVAEPHRFAAHSSAISTLEFDASGQLLVTASTNGKTLKIFSLSSLVSPQGPQEEEGRARQPQLLYRLVRGTLIDADICGLSFSADRRWLAVSSSHGTAHMFAINAAGGAVDAITHGSGADTADASPIAENLSWRAALPGAAVAVNEQRAVAMVKRSWPPISQMVAQACPSTEQFTAYTVLCYAHDGSSWSVQKRYSELAALKDKLTTGPDAQHSIVDALKSLEFPAKTWSAWGKMDEQVVAERQASLQLWLNHVIQRCPNNPDVLDALRAPPPQDAAMGGRQKAAAVESEAQWPINVKFVGAQTKSEWTVPMAACWLPRGGGGILPDPSQSGSLRHSVGSCYIFATGELSLHHVMLDLKVGLASAGSARLNLADR